MAAYDILGCQGSSWDGKLATAQTCLKSNEPAIRYGHYTVYQLIQNPPGKRLSMGRVKVFCKPKYFSRHVKSAKVFV